MSRVYSNVRDLKRAVLAASKQRVAPEKALAMAKMVERLSSLLAADLVKVEEGDPRAHHLVIKRLMGGAFAKSGKLKGDATAGIVARLERLLRSLDSIPTAKWKQMLRYLNGAAAHLKETNKGVYSHLWKQNYPHHFGAVWAKKKNPNTQKKATVFVKSNLDDALEAINLLRAKARGKVLGSKKGS